MTRRQITKEAYRRIITENESHQDVYDDLKTKTEIGSEQVAKIVGLVPSQEKRERNQMLVYVYVAIMGIIIVLRSLGIFVMLNTMNTPVLLLFIVIGLIVPVAAIWASLTHRVSAYYSVAGLMAFNIFRSFTRDSNLMDNPINMIALIPFVLGIVLAIILAQRLKVNHELKMVDSDVDGVKKKTQKVIFETEDHFSSSEILDR